MLLKTPRVHAPQDDTSLLVDTMRREPLREASRVLDVGTGSGALALAAARHGAAHVTAVDASLRAVLTARFNARLSRLPIEVLHGNLLVPVRGRRFDLIVANPAYAAGSGGRVTLDRICRGVLPLLVPGGVLLMVHSALRGTGSTLEHLRRGGLHAGVVERRRMLFEEEGLVVIRAVRVR